VTSLAEALDLRDKELVSIVGGGGKSTLMFGLGHELANTGRRVILTTTTKMGREQTLVVPTVCWSADAVCIEEVLGSPGPVMLVTQGDAHKVTGPAPDLVNRLYANCDADYIIVEADGSQGRPLKAPASHEPVVASASTTVIILMGIDAVGRPLGEVTHRVAQAMSFTGLQEDHILTPRNCAEILTHRDGALRACPPQSRVLVALTKVRTPSDMIAAAEVELALSGHPQIESCLQIDLDVPSGR
jgi:probable selenium-dependent hydroxylase accessory protein YqeC